MPAYVLEAESHIARYTFGTQGLSSNAKIGPVYATYRALGTVFTCPTACVMVSETDSSCYANDHLVGMNQRRARTEVLDVAVYIGQLKPRKDGKRVGVRHLVSGDLKERGAVSWAYIDGLVAGHTARPDTYGWGYTHAWRDLPVARVNGAPNCTINASCETEADIRQALAAGWSPATIVAPDAPAGISATTDAYAVLTCPQQTGNATCDTCRLCAYPVTNRKRQFRGLPMVIGFRVHGRITTVSKAVGGMWLEAPTA